MQDEITQDEIDAILKTAMGEADTEANEKEKPDANPADRENIESASPRGVQEQGTQNTKARSVERSEAAPNRQEQTKTFQSTTEAYPGASTGESGNIALLLDVPLDVSVELGRTKIAIRDVLQLVPGSVIELDKLIGEPVDLIVNDRLIARGEVVVLDENFGVRITDIVNTEDRIRNLR